MQQYDNKTDPGVANKSDRKRSALIVCGAVCSLIFLGAGCHQPSASSIQDRPVNTPQTHNDISARLIEITPPAHPPLPVHSQPRRDDHPRWLMTERYELDSEDTWVNASFEVNRNKIKINIRNIRQFAIDTRRIHIDWKRRVILSINDRNSELKKRDYPIIRFALDEYNQWYVVEPN